MRTCWLRIARQVRRQECFLAVAVALVGVCCLLLLGSRYVPYLTLPLTAAFGAWLAVRRWQFGLPGGYRVAQRIDRIGGFSDQLATAYYFRSASADGVSRQVVDEQYERAVESAEAIDPEEMFPVTWPGTQKASSYLLASALLLFGLRAGVQSELSFEPPLASLLLESLFGYDPQPKGIEQLQAARIDQEEIPSIDRDDGDLVEKAGADSGPSEEELPSERFDEESGEDELPEVEGLITLPLEEQAVDEMLAEDSLQSDGGENSDGDDSGDASNDPTEDIWDEETQSLLDKLKQAFENMLETLEMASAESTDSEAGQEEGSGDADGSESAGEPADSGDPDDQMSTEAADASMEGGEPGEEAGETASAGNTSGEDSSGDQSSGENASAAGTSDGLKEFAEAEQLEVLGALEELYMERAENMKGDVTIETRLAEQSASVPYNERTTAHADQGGAISRDEIPSAYRTYIQNYFETLRRNAE